MDQFNYFSLIRKSDGKEVYTSPDYTIESGSEVMDIKKICERFRFYFSRVNSGIMQQKESNKLSDDEKASLKFITPKDYKIQYVAHQELGCMFRKVYFTIEATNWLKEEMI